MVVSMGSEGVYYASNKAKIHYPCFPCKAVNTTGCGDSLMGAIAWAVLEGETVKKAIQCGLAAASICIETIGAVSEGLTKENLYKRINNKI